MTSRVGIHTSLGSWDLAGEPVNQGTQGKGEGWEGNDGAGAGPGVWQTGKPVEGVWCVPCVILPPSPNPCPLFGQNPHLTPEQNSGSNPISPTPTPAATSYQPKFPIKAQCPWLTGFE